MDCSSAQARPPPCRKCLGGCVAWAWRCADALHRNPEFMMWASAREADRTMFGAVGDVLSRDWSGMMGWAFPPDDPWIWGCLVDRVARMSATALPTRIVLLMETDAKALTEIRKHVQAQVVCEFAPGQLPMVNPLQFKVGYSSCGRLAAGAVVVMIENEQARDRSPVDMQALAGALTQWAAKQRVECRVLVEGREEVAPVGGLHHWWLHAQPYYPSKDGKLNWFHEVSSTGARAVALARHEVKDQQQRLDKIAKFDRYLGALGLEPVELRATMTDMYPKTKEGRKKGQATVSALSKTVLLGTWQLWSDRRHRDTAWRKRAQGAMDPAVAGVWRRKGGKRKAAKLASTAGGVAGRPPAARQRKGRKKANKRTCAVAGEEGFSEFSRHGNRKRKADKGVLEKATRRSARVLERKAERR